MKKPKTFQEVRNFLNSIDNINMGGCLISAYSMYLWLKKNNQLPDDFRILQKSNGEFSRLANALFYLKGEDKFGISCGHAVVYMGGKLLDSTDEQDISNCSDIVLRSVIVNPVGNEEHLIKQMNSASWNQSFNRKENIPKIAKALDIDLSNLRLKLPASEYEEYERFKDENANLVNANRNHF